MPVCENPDVGQEKPRSLADPKGPKYLKRVVVKIRVPFGVP